MPDNSNRPREFDAVLGGEVRPPIDGVVLGGIEGVKRRLTENSFKAKYTALINALNYGDDGLDIVIEALYSQPLSIRKTAYYLLKNNSHLKAKAVIKAFNKYQLFECIHSMDGHSYEVTDLTYMPNKNILISASKDTTIKVWNSKTAQLIHTLNLSVQAWKVDFVFTSVSQDAQTLCASTERGSKIKVWNLQTGERSYILQEHHNYDSSDMSLFVMSPNGKVLFSNNYDSIIKVWDLTTGQKISNFDLPSKITLLCVNPDDKTLLCACKSDILIICSQTGKIETIIPTGTMCDVWFFGNPIIKNGKHVACGIENYGTDPEIIFIDVETGNRIRTFTDKSMNIKTIGFSNNAKILATGGVTKKGNNGIIKLWDLEQEIEMHTLEDFQGSINAITISPDGEMIFSSDDDMSIKIWSLH